MSDSLVCPFADIASKAQTFMRYRQEFDGFLIFPTAPGGTLSDDMTRTEFCLFTAQEDLETMQAYAQVNSEETHVKSKPALTGQKS